MAVSQRRQEIQGQGCTYLPPEGGSGEVDRVHRLCGREDLRELLSAERVDPRAAGETVIFLLTLSSLHRLQC